MPPEAMARKSSTSLMDRNYFSFNGPINSGQVVHLAGVMNGAGYDDTVKCSTGLRNFRAVLGTVISGSEDALDVNNHCQNLEIHASRWVFPLGHAATGFTVKGNSHNITISGDVDGDPLVDLGNASDQSTVWCTGIRLNLRRLDRKPIRVRVLCSTYPEEVAGSGPYEYVFPSNIRWSPLRRFLMKCFMELRRHGIGNQK
jgi:hypothetical protein